MTWVAADVWLHGASAGDVRALAPLVARLRVLRPDLSALLTTRTATGRAMACSVLPDLPCGSPPLDLPPFPARALAAVRPRLVILEYLELWPAFIAACHRARVPVAVIDGRITRRSLRVAPLLRRTARRLSVFCARTEADAVAARALGVPPPRVRVCGNGKYDGLASKAPVPSAGLRAAVGSFDVVIGSLHPDEESAALPALAASGLRALIAPRYPRRAAALVRAARRLGVPARRRDEIGEEARWVVLDTVGELAAAYALGRVAVIGGTFGRRDGQNLVEAAAHGLPVVHGPRVANVRVEADALAGRGGWPVDDWRPAFARAAELLHEPGPDPRPALAALRGATERNLEALRPWIGRIGSAEGRGPADSPLLKSPRRRQKAMEDP